MRTTSFKLFLATTALVAAAGLSLAVQPVRAAEEATSASPAPVTQATDAAPAAETAAPDKTTPDKATPDNASPDKAAAENAAAERAAAENAATEKAAAEKAAADRVAVEKMAAEKAAAEKAAGEKAAAETATVEKVAVPDGGAGATTPAATTPAATTQAAPTEPATPPAAAVETLTPDQRIAEKIHEMFGGRIERILDRRNSKAVEAFYTARNFAPLWVENGAEADRAKAAATYLAGVAADGLDPAEYPVPNFASADPTALADAELKFTASVLAYARHAQIGRVHYSRVSPDIAFNLVAPEAGDVLHKLAEAADEAAALDSFNPPHAGYRALKAKLAELRGDGAAPARIESGPTLKPGMSDPRVPLVRERLGAAAGDDTIYDKALSDRVKEFQRQHDLTASGTLTPGTVAAINGPRRDREADVIIANMERWRWLPRDLGEYYVMVNIPDYTLRVMKGDTLVWTTKIVAGQPGEKATPLLSETMKYITVNPTWNVPPSIINNEYLPALERDPTVLDRMGLKVEYNRDGTVHIFQPPGDGNALGRIRFNFPNKFLVYQHDTPDKKLFMQAKRAFSHGCMRVQFPDKYAEVLLGISNPGDGYTAEKIHKLYGIGEHDIHLNTPIPVHITYQTAFVDDAGHLVIRDDVYGRDARQLAVMKEERRVADVAVAAPRDPNAAKKQAARMPPPSGAGGFNLFGGLFR